jgi:hypothetical protein
MYVAIFVNRMPLGSRIYNFQETDFGGRAFSGHSTRTSVVQAKGSGHDKDWRFPVIQKVEES